MSEQGSVRPENKYQNTQRQERPEEGNGCYCCRGRGINGLEGQSGNTKANAEDQGSSEARSSGLKRDEKYRVIEEERPSERDPPTKRMKRQKKDEEKRAQMEARPDVDEWHWDEVKPDIKIKRPSQPTEAEKEEHCQAGHFPFREWCEACVEGRAENDPHSGEGKDKRDEECTKNVIAIDYAYMGKKDEGMPILVMKDRRTKMRFADVVPEKGSHSFRV